LLSLANRGGVRSSRKLDRRGFGVYPTREKRALEMFVIEGIKTSIQLKRRILADADFAAGKIDTHFIERLLGTNGK
jgi:pyruvate carboxylase